MDNERGRSIRQIVADAYTWLWDFFWWPIRFGAGVFLSHEWLPKFAPWIIAARLGRWPQKVNINHYRICNEANCEICRSLKPNEIDIDDEQEIKHYPRLTSNPETVTQDRH